MRFFGGSTMWGTGADDAGTIPAIYQRAHPDERVFNHGEWGYNTRQNLARLINILNQGQPADVVVFYEGVNDVGSLCRADVSINGQDQESRMRAVLDRAESDRGGSEPTLGSAIKTLLYRRTAELIARVTGRSSESGPEFGDTDVDDGSAICATDHRRRAEVAKTVLDNLRIAHRLVTAAGGRFIAILQPVSFVGRPRLDRIRLHKKAGKDFRAVYSIWQSAAHRIGWLYDLTSSFDGDRYVYIDRVHVSENGNAIIARKISDIIGPRR